MTPHCSCPCHLTHNCALETIIDRLDWAERDHQERLRDAEMAVRHAVDWKAVAARPDIAELQRRRRHGG